MAIVTRASKGSALTYAEMDDNFNQVPNGANSSITDDGSGIVVAGNSKFSSTVNKVYTYGKEIASLTDGNSSTVAHIPSGSDGEVALIEITAISGDADKAKAVFYAHNASGTWTVNKQDVFTGTNLVLEAVTSDSGSTYDINVKASGADLTKAIRTIVQAMGSIDTSYIER